VDAYTFDGTESRKLSLEILLRSLIAETGDNQRLEGIPSDERIFVRFICKASHQQGN
jgi:hypothetical protein